MKQKLSYCGELVRAHDPDRFLLSMFAPAPAREGLWALFAFNHEIAKTREVVSEAQLGRIRLQWWREALAAIYKGGEVPQHEVLKPLAGVIAAYDLPHAGLERLIDAREFDLEDEPPETLEGLLIYADHSSTPLMEAAVRICGDDPALEPVQPVAINYALAGILRALSYGGTQGQAMIPEELIRGGSKTPDIARRISDEFVFNINVKNNFLKVSDKLSGLYMRQIKTLGYDVEHPRMRLDPPFKALRLVLGL